MSTIGISSCLALYSNLPSGGELLALYSQSESLLKENEESIKNLTKLEAINSYANFVRDGLNKQLSQISKISVWARRFFNLFYKLCRSSCIDKKYSLLKRNISELKNVIEENNLKISNTKEKITHTTAQLQVLEAATGEKVNSFSHEIIMDLFGGEDKFQALPELKKEQYTSKGIIDGFILRSYLNHPIMRGLDDKGRLFFVIRAKSTEFGENKYQIFYQTAKGSPNWMSSSQTIIKCRNDYFLFNPMDTEFLQNLKLLVQKVSAH